MPIEETAPEMEQEAQEFEKQQFTERLKTEKQEYINETRDFFAKEFENNPEALESVNLAVNYIEKADAEHPEVKYHNSDHVLSMARNAVESVDKIAKQTDISIPDNMKKLIALAGILHDTGYYEKDPKFGTMKIDHETRSQNFIADRADKLNLAEENVRHIQTMIEGTRFSTGLKNIEDIKQISDEDERAAQLGASILGTLDVLGTDHNYLQNVSEGLQPEFEADKKLLQTKLQEQGIKGADAIKTAAEQGNMAAQEYQKIPVAPTGPDQVKNTKFFYDFAVPARLAKTGLIEVEDGKFVPEKSLLSEKAVLQARKNQDTIYDYFEKGKVPEEIKAIA